MSTVFNIHLTFFEPYRMVRYCGSGHEDYHKFLRGQSYAVLYDKPEPRLVVTGTLLRSAVVRAAEQILILTNNKWNCCNEVFDSSNKQRKPRFYRKSPASKWPNLTARKCIKNDFCPFCLLLGRRFDDTDKKNEDNLDDYLIHFGNLKLANGRLFTGNGLEERVLNRVDYNTGKADDYFKVCEVDDTDYMKFAGKITINESLVKKCIQDDNKANDLIKSTEELLTQSLAFTDRLCGAMCIVSSSPVPDDDNEKDLPVVDIIPLAHDTADRITEIFKEETDKLRLIADAIRSMRSELPDIVEDLPKGKDRKHFLWGGTETNSARMVLTQSKGEFLKAVNEEAKRFCSEKKKPLQEQEFESKAIMRDWRKFCDELGQRLYNAYKDRMGGVIMRRRMLGDSQNYSKTCGAGKVFPIDGVPQKEWIFMGRLRAETPFYFGTETKSGEQTSFQILLDKKTGKYRIPRSVLRGVLRHDLRFAFDTGCRADPGRSRPCDCPVCQVMRGITIMDSKSDYCEPPEVRQRIRIDSYSGTVEEGALFDIEVGPEKITFPFIMRYRGIKPEDELMDVLYSWTQGMAFLGGSTSTGKGRFELENLEYYEWDLRNNLNRYLEKYGFRDIIKPDKLQETLSGIGLSPTQVNKSDKYRPQWTKVIYEIEMQSPLLSNDPIAALFDEKNHDAVMFKKPEWNGGDIEYKPAFKGESIRGIFRTAVGRNETKKEDGKVKGLLELDHEDCTCKLCSIFGNEHEAGKIRFEDLKIENYVEKHLDHVAIDRFTGGAADKKKFDHLALAGSPGNPLRLTGHLWLRHDFKDKDALVSAFCDIKNSLYPLGGKGGIGYGWVSGLIITEGPQDIKDKVNNCKNDDSAAPHSQEQATTDQTETFYAVSCPLLDPNAIYYPHYFLEPADKVIRDNKIPLKGHQKFHERHLTGKIKCTLKTLTPLIIPDTENNDAFSLRTKESKIHTSFSFFRINGKEMIPGSEIRGPISSVYEALTNSCFRVMEENRYLTRRMKPKDEFYPGIIRCIGKDIFVVQTKEYRLPLYDDPSVTAKITLDLSMIADKCIRFEHREKTGKAIAMNNNIASWAQQNNKVLKDNPAALSGTQLVKFTPVNDTNKADIMALLENGTKEGYVKFTGLNMVSHEKWEDGPEFYPDGDVRTLDVLLSTWIDDLSDDHKALFENRLFRNAPTKPKSCLFYSFDFNHQFTIEKLCEEIEGRGYSITLQNYGKTLEWLNELVCLPAFYDAVVSKEKSLDIKNSKINNLIKDTSSYRTKNYNKLDRNQKGNIKMLNRLLIEYIFDKYCPKMHQRFFLQYPRPLLLFVKDKKRYVIQKRCERIFLKPDNSALEFPVHPTVANKYRDIVRDYKENYSRIDKRFTTIFQHDTLENGDLVYFAMKNGRVSSIVPVRISRSADSDPLSKRFSDNHEISDALRPCEREILEDIDTSKLADFSEKYLFRRHPNGLCPACRLFGTTHYKGRVRFGFAELQEEPKWLMDEDENGNRCITLPLLEKPRPTWSMPEEKSEVPGRKFYVHHNGWEKIKEDFLKGDADYLRKTENNRTVEPLAEGNEFKFDVFFENLEEWELGLLLYSLELEDGLAHKIGMGKASGFGSVKIEVDKISQREKGEKACLWKDVTGEKDKYLQSGLDKLLSSSWFGSCREDWERMFNNLRRLLYCRHKEDITVEYPKLEGTGELPGYKKLNDAKKCPYPLEGTAELKKEQLLKWRRYYLTTPWTPWYPYQYPTIEDKDASVSRNGKSRESEKDPKDKESI
ncbi:MAG: type III-E CRISPR-associated gRAMP effector Cas7-11 [Nitrospirota bacterium]